MIATLPSRLNGSDNPRLIAPDNSPPLVIEELSVNFARRPSDFRSPSKLPITACPTRKSTTRNVPFRFRRRCRAGRFDAERHQAIHWKSFASASWKNSRKRNRRANQIDRNIRVAHAIFRSPGDDARAAARLFARSEEPQLRIGDAHFVMRRGQLAAQAIEHNTVNFAVGEIKKPVDVGLAPRAAPVKLSAQFSVYRILHVDQFLERIHRRRIETGVHRPRIVGKKTPVGQLEISVHKRIDGAASQMRT